MPCRIPDNGCYHIIYLVDGTIVLSTTHCQMANGITIKIAILNWCVVSRPKCVIFSYLLNTYQIHKIRSELPGTP